MVVVGAVGIAPIGGGNATTLPAQRHLVRVEHPGGGASLLLALQQDGRDGRGLGLWRSDDEGRTWRYEAALQNDFSERDTADLLVTGRDLALVYSYEGPELTASLRHDVYFQRWRYQSQGPAWAADAPVLVFDASSGAQAFYRATLALDSSGRIWVSAFRMETGGGATAVVAVSSNGGLSFTEQSPLDSLASRGGGRIVSLGTKLLFVYARHDSGQPTRMRLRLDSAPVGQWEARSDAFGEGIYHGAAFSAAADGTGGLHLAYKDETERLFYRYFDGSSFGPAFGISPSSDWALQPALVRVGSAVVVFFNEPAHSGAYSLKVVTLGPGGFLPPEVLETSATFKGYPAALEALPSGAASVPCVFGETPTAADMGEAKVSLRGALPAVDAGVPLPPAGLLFSDDFGRTVSNGLGSSWTVAAGLWVTQGRAVSDLDGSNLAYPAGIVCLDCRVAAEVTSFGVPEAGVFLRATPGAAQSRYELSLLSNGKVAARRVSLGVATALGEAPSGLSALDQPAVLSLTVSGSSPVLLTGEVNGVPRLWVTDTSPGRLTAPGVSGLSTTRAGVPFDAFRLWGLASAGDAGPPEDAGKADGGLNNDAGRSDAGVGTDAGRADGGAGTDAGRADGGVGPDAGADTDGGRVDSGTQDAGALAQLLFFDDFSRTSASGLGSDWEATSGLWVTSGAAISDLDGDDLARALPAACADCRVEASVLGFGVPEAALVLRSQVNAPRDRYDLVLMGSGRVQVRRHTAGVASVLGEATSGLSALDEPATLSLEASGASPAVLVAKVNGAVKLTAVDLASSPLGSGRAGLWTRNAGVVFDSFRLWSLGNAPPTLDAGASTDAGTPTGSIGLVVSFASNEYEFLGVGTDGTAYALKLRDSRNRLWASTDQARTFSLRASPGLSFWEMATLADGTLLADVTQGGRHKVARSTDQGRTWTVTLDIGSYRWLTPHSVAELGGRVYLAEYQDFSSANTAVHLWVSTNAGASFSLKNTFSGHRHAHGLRADPARNALWVFFGDTTDQSGVYRSEDQGTSWVLVQAGQEGDVVDAEVTGEGLLFGQDISFLPDRPKVVSLGFSGGLSVKANLPGPSYSIHRISSGGFVLGTAREPRGDLYPPGEVSAHLFLSSTGESWTDFFQYPRASAAENARADVYWELASGELVVELENIQGKGPGGKGFQLLRVTR